ncbi:MAG: YodL domain-containing protein [Firmicutes bacterium]|nr:YodL domain-containing protein [Bacillota bacterium]
MKTEKEFLESKAPSFAIYQIKRGDDFRDLRFEPFQRLIDLGKNPERTNYDFIYAAPFVEEETLEQIFTRFNLNRPADFMGHSLSVSDVVAINKGGNITAHYVDSFGYQTIAGFLG